MAKDSTAAAKVIVIDEVEKHLGTMATTKTKRFHQRERFLGGDGATVTVFINESKKGGYNVGTTLRERGQKPQTGCPATKPTLDEAKAEFETIAGVALAHGWVKKEKKVRVPKAPAFTLDTFPTAKPYVPGLTFPKVKAAKKSAKKTAKK
jgi:hypothetical protein